MKHITFLFVLLLLCVHGTAVAQPPAEPVPTEAPPTDADADSAQETPPADDTAPAEDTAPVDETAATDGAAPVDDTTRTDGTQTPDDAEPTNDAAAEDTAATTTAAAIDTANTSADGTDDAEPDEGRDPNQGSLIQEDVEPSVTIVAADGLELAIGALTQVHLSPLVGEDALIENGDPASDAGFRIRRARIGFAGNLGGDFGIFLTLNLIGVDSEDGVVSDAKVVWNVADELRMSIGSGKAPFSRANLNSSRRLPMVERPLSANQINPGRRLGFTVDGTLFGKYVAYFAGIGNGTRGFAQGNRFGGLLYGGRLEVRPWGNPDQRDPWQDGIAVAGGAYYDDGPSTNTFAWTADIFAAYAGAFAIVEYLCDTTTPDDEPLVSAGVAPDTERCGGYVEAGYTLPWLKKRRIQAVARVETYDDNKNVEDTGDVILAGGGINAYVAYPYIRAQLHYMAKLEQEGQALKNNILTLVMQGTF